MSRTLRASASTTTTTIRFADLAHHLEEQIRGSTDGGTVNRYRLAMREGEEFPPLLVAKVAEALILVDGFHRRDALEALDRDEAPATIVPCANLQEARWLGFAANLRHGQPLRKKLLRPALRAYLDAGKHRLADGRLQSYRELAGAVPGISYSTARRWIEADYPVLFQAMGGQESSAPGGVEGLRPPTPEEVILDVGRHHIAEALALLRNLPGELRRLAAVDVEALAAALTWDDREASNCFIGTVLSTKPGDSTAF